MQIIKKFDKAANLIYYAAVLIHILIMCEGFSVWETPFRGRLLQIACVLCCIKILMTYYEKVEWALIGIAGALSIASYACTKEKYVVYVAVLIIAARNVDMKVVLSLIFEGVLISTVLIAIFALTGLGGDISETRDFGRGIVETRYMLGFSHANNLHGTVWYIFAAMILLYKKKINWKIYAAATVLNIVLYCFTHSKTGLLVAQIVIIGGVLYTYFDKQVFEKIWAYITGAVVYILILILTIVSVTVNPWDNYGKFLTRLNDILTNRIKLSYESAYIGDWNALSVGGSHKDTIDNGFVALAAEYGYIILAVYAVFVGYLFYKSYKEKEGAALVILVTAVMYIFMERSYMINDAFLLSNLIYVIAMMFMGIKKGDNIQGEMQS